jgi:hypothetical protein
LAFSRPATSRASPRPPLTRAPCDIASSRRKKNWNQPTKTHGYWTKDKMQSTVRALHEITPGVPAARFTTSSPR